VSVKVNLLPRELAEDRAARRVTAMTGAAVLAFVVVLGLVYLLQTNELRRAEEERDATQAEVARLRAELAGLEQFRQLADELEARNALLASAMADEVSFARLLNDLSLAFPTSASLRGLSVSVTPSTAVGLEPTLTQGATVPVATLTYDGYSVERYAPGVETVVIEFDKVRGFYSTFIGTASVEEIGTTEVTTFQGTVQVDDLARTGRYEAGLPGEQLR
jgi:Tfp pilus assembly protein PilN